MESSQDRNLPATERKLHQARQDGEASRSRDLSHVSVLGVGGLALMALAPAGLARLEHALGQQLVFDAAIVLQPATMMNRLQDMVALGALISLLFATIVSAATALATVLAGGWVYSFKPIAPNFGRLNPLAGLGNLFSKQQFATVVKMIVLTTVLLAVAWAFMSHGIAGIAALVLQPSNAAIAHAADWIVSGMGLLLLVVCASAVIDVPLQNYFFKTKLKMSHEEVKQEHKESEGSPQTKSRIRSRQREIANRASIAAVPKADFVVMNPTHFAVALKYDESSMGAPQVVAKGADLLAMKIREVAKAHAVPVLESPVLARALYAHAELDQPIPASLYAAVAQVLAYVYRLKAALRGAGPMPDAAPEPFVPQELDPLHPAASKKAAA
ncbi:EscU/YscU/HrcU family type III secretion system export apparatus switch protein [Ramlibacter sp. H39-3-26]|uniref:EscU/YscU/HrcU family type III secretion system export apparatus switch protein n=1 Tax=Curvibacter soli TaxID=3031331 RepID=UPI0023DCDA2D|nr:EscU/YscU/HrcU family type III secretion system export apparatus switch protein [Ramlibacter sp. H39-3-26]MDF1485792.1 EscU/YscU/HrcU family type III secretion system export apparatus switch protein [Ramlibacter sp. H39-3-26]